MAVAVHTGRGIAALFLLDLSGSRAGPGDRAARATRRGTDAFSARRISYFARTVRYAARHAQDEHCDSDGSGL